MRFTLFYLPSAMLALALLELPYFYFQILRMVVCGAAIGFVVLTWDTERLRLARWIFVPIAVLFNPLIPLHLGRDIWMILDIIVAVIFVVASFIPKKTELQFG